MGINNLKRFFIAVCAGVLIFSLYACDDGSGAGGDNGGPIITDPTFNLRILEMDAPTTADEGDAISVDYTLYMDWTVNSGAYNDSFNVRFCLSGDESIDSSDTLIGEESFNNVDMYALDDQENTATVSIPAETAGTYYIGIIVDSGNDIAESNEGDNTISDLIEITEPAELQPNLDITYLAYSGGTSIGDEITISYNFENDGEAASGSFNASFYISTDQTISQADTLLGSVALGSLAQGAATGVSNTDVTIPAGLSAGTYYIGCIVDPENTVNESNEADNISTGILVLAIDIDHDIPNLRPRALVTPVSVLEDGSITITLQVENVGNEIAGLFDVDVYLSSDTTINTSDTLLTSATTESNLTNGQYVEIEISNVVVSGINANTYRYIGFIVDTDDDIFESNENDNITTSGSALVNQLYILEEDTAVFKIVNNYGNGIGGLYRRAGNITSWGDSSVVSYGTTYAIGTYCYYLPAATYDFRMLQQLGYSSGWQLFDISLEAGAEYTWTLTSGNRETW